MESACYSRKYLRARPDSFQLGILLQDNLIARRRNALKIDLDESTTRVDAIALRA